MPHLAPLRILPDELLDVHPNLKMLADDPEIIDTIPEEQRMQFYAEACELISELEPDVNLHEPVDLSGVQNASLWLVVHVNPMERPRLMGRRPHSPGDSFIIPDDKPQGESIIINDEKRRQVVMEGIPFLTKTIRKLRTSAMEGDAPDIEHQEERLRHAVQDMRRKLIDMDRAHVFNQGISVR